MLDQGYSIYVSVAVATISVEFKHRVELYLAEKNRLQRPRLYRQLAKGTFTKHVQWNVSMPEEQGGGGPGRSVSCYVPNNTRLSWKSLRLRAGTPRLPKMAIASLSELPARYSLAV